MNIGIDVDNVLNNMGELIVHFLNKTYNKDINFNNLKSYNLKHAYPDLSFDEIFSPLCLAEFWENLKVNKDGLDFINYVTSQNDSVYLITAQVDQGFEYKRNWMKANISNIPIDNHIFCVNKELINTDYLIDDYINNLINFKNNKILFSQPYNKAIYVPSDIKKVDAITDCIRFIYNNNNAVAQVI